MALSSKLILFISLMIYINQPVLALAIAFNVVSTGNRISDGASDKTISGYALTPDGPVKVTASTKENEDKDETSPMTHTIITEDTTKNKLDGKFVIVDGIDPKKIKNAVVSGDFETGIVIKLGANEYELNRILSNNKTKLAVTLTKKGKTIKKQTIYICTARGESYPYCGDEGFQKLIWAGDLDGDGELDLVLSLSEKYSYRPYYLYLSGSAKKDELIKLIATDESYSC